MDLLKTPKLQGFPSFFTEWASVYLLNGVRLGSYCEVNNTKEKCKTVHTVFFIAIVVYYMR